jgi:hypothetical protein
LVASKIDSAITGGSSWLEWGVDERFPIETASGASRWRIAPRHATDGVPTRSAQLRQAWGLTALSISALGASDLPGDAWFPRNGQVPVKLGGARFS